VSVAARAGQTGVIVILLITLGVLVGRALARQRHQSLLDRYRESHQP